MYSSNHLFALNPRLGASLSETSVGAWGVFCRLVTPDYTNIILLSIPDDKVQGKDVCVWCDTLVTGRWRSSLSMHSIYSKIYILKKEYILTYVF